MNAGPFLRGGVAYWRVGAERADDAIECAERVVIDGGVVESHVIVVGGDRHVFTAQPGAAAGHDGDDVSRGEEYRGSGDVEVTADRGTGGTWRERGWRRA